MGYPQMQGNVNLDRNVSMWYMLVYFFDLKKVSRPFNVYAQLEEMLALRKLGWSYMALSDRFKVPKTTIRYLCRKFGLNERSVKVTIFRTENRTTIKRKTIFYNERDEIINPGKTYAEYLQEERDRKWRRLTQKQ